MVAAALALVAAVPAFAQDEGGSLEPQVVGGSSVPDGKYRFMASLQANFPGDGVRGKHHFCGATLIDRNHVLTAAHCVEFFGGQVSVKSLRVVVGVTMLGSDQGQARSVDRLGAIAIHPRYTGGRSNRYDAAVIRLSRPVSGISPIKLLTPRNNGPERAGNQATITGWGTTREGARRSPKRMQEGHPGVVSDRAGKKAYGGQYEPRLMIAAGKGRVDTCQGDSGGPMFDRVGGTRRQFGITSFGRRCAQEGYPGVYTEVNNPSITRFIRRESGL
jgi:secreted trypsin-like serine protease